MPVVDGVCISVSRHSDSKAQKTVNSAKIQYMTRSRVQSEMRLIEKCQQRTTECLLQVRVEGLDQKTNHQEFMKTEIGKIFV